MLGTPSVLIIRQMINKDEILRGYLKRMGGVWVVAVQMIQPA